MKRLLFICLLFCNVLSGLAFSVEEDLALLRRLYSLRDDGYNKLVAQVVASKPDFARIGSIGMSREGRPITLVTVTNFAQGGEDKPAYFIQGHIHSKEMSGSVAGIHLIKCLLRDVHNRDLLDRFVFYFIPRCNPDGAHHMTVLPADERSAWGKLTHLPNAFEPCDVNGDGRVTMMRKESPEGKMVSADNGRGMCGRKPQSKGPYYIFMMEGVYHDWDGHFIGRNTPWWREWLDWNRDWPWGWRADQKGAGPCPLSAPEVRLQHDWIRAHRNIRASICLHNGWGSVMTPTLPDDKIRKKINRLAFRAGELCGQWVRYETSPSGENRKHQSSGTFDDWMMNELGIPCLTIELGTRETSAGISSEYCFTTKWYPWDNVAEVIEEQKTHPEFGECIFEWKKFCHPQLGEVEIGGSCPTIFASPTAEYLLKVTNGVYAFIVEHAREIVAGK